MELGENRVWDYVGDNFVHRLVQTDDQSGKLVEAEGNGPGYCKGLLCFKSCLIIEKLNDVIKYAKKKPIDMFIWCPTLIKISLELIPKHLLQPQCDGHNLPPMV